MTVINAWQLPDGMLLIPTVLLLYRATSADILPRATYSVAQFSHSSCPNSCGICDRNPNITLCKKQAPET